MTYEFLTATEIESLKATIRGDIARNNKDLTEAQIEARVEERLPVVAAKADAAKGERLALEASRKAAHKAELAAKRAAKKAKAEALVNAVASFAAGQPGEGEVKLIAPAWESEKAYGFDFEVRDARASSLPFARARAFLPKSQVRQGCAPKWLVERATREAVAKIHDGDHAIYDGITA